MNGKDSNLGPVSDWGMMMYDGYIYGIHGYYGMMFAMVKIFKILQDNVDHSFSNVSPFWFSVCFTPARPVCF